MEDLSLHILDIAENSINAGAMSIHIVIIEDTLLDLLTIGVTDDGKGMDAGTTVKAANPFYTTRTTRRVGLGLPLLDEAAKAANGKMTVQSVPGIGTTVTATFQLSHIDRKPLGQMADTITTLIAGRPDVDIVYRHERNGEALAFSTKEIKQRFDGLPLNATETLSFIKNYLTQEENSLTHHA